MTTKMASRQFWIEWVIVPSLIAGICTSVGYYYGRSHPPWVECCVEGEWCQDEDEWAKVLMDCTGDKGDAEEMSKILGECWVDQDKLRSENYKLRVQDPEELTEVVKCGIKLAEMRGALKECQRK
jgi:hypothetical protein